MKTHVLTVSRNFPATHKRKGEPTFFVEKILNERIPFGLIHIDERARLEPFDMKVFNETMDGKIHTIRANYELWKKRIEEVSKGEAILSVRYWSGRPYKSKQVTICNLTKDDGVGIQKLWSFGLPVWSVEDAGFPYHGSEELCQNDGLSLKDFNEWFRKYDLSKPMAIIHFTNFRY